MRKMFTRLFSLALLTLLLSAVTVVNAQTDPCLDIVGDDVVLVTDPATVCDSMDLLYAVVGFPTSEYEFAFNYAGSTTGGFTSDSTVLVPEGVAFTVQIRRKAPNTSCTSDVLNVLNESMIEPVNLLEPGVEHPLCFDGMGEVTVRFEGDHAPYTFYCVSQATWLANGEAAGTYTGYSSSQFIRGPGTYFVAVQDANDCIDLTDVANWDTAVVNPAPAEIIIDDVVGVDPVCNGGDGSITVTVASGGGTPFASGEYIVAVGAEMDTTSSLEASFDLPAGSYAVTVYDSLGCYTLLDSMVVLTDPDVVTFDVSIEDVTCAEGANGIIYVTNFDGGSGSTYYAGLGDGNWIEAVNDSVKLDGLYAGYYSVYVKQETACDSVGYVNPNNTQNTVSIQAPGEITYDVTYDEDITCNGGTTTISVTNVTGGVPPYQYQLNSGAWGSTNSWSVGAGSYVVNVRDANEVCVISYPTTGSINISQPSTVAFDEIDIISPTCFDATDGVINIMAYGGNGTYQYSIDGTNWKENNIFAVPAGTYTVYARDPLCPAQAVSSTVTVNALAPNALVLLDAPLTDTVNECYGINSNAIVVGIDTWASQVGETRELTVVITDDVNNVYNEEIGTEMEQGFMGNWRIDDVDPGTYYIWAVDNMGCVFDADQDGEADYITVQVIEPEQLAVSGAVTEEATCYGDNDGILTIKHNGGGNDNWYGYAHANTIQAALNLSNGAFTEWPTDVDSVNIQVSGSVEGTPYYVVVMDDCGQKVVSNEFIVYGLDPVTIDEDAIDVTDIVCFGDETGVIEIPAAEGGTGDFVYTLQVSNEGWDDVEDYVDVTETVFTGLGAGNYRVIVTDNGGCEGVTTETIVVDGPESGVEIDYYWVEDITCNGASDGKITVEVSGGVGKYQFKVGTTNWRNFDANSPNVKTIVITEPGDYTVWVRDSLECTTDGIDFTIDEPEAIGLEVVPTASTNCEDSNGKLSITVTGGRPEVTYTIMVNDSTYAWVVKTDTTYVSEGLAGGEYKVTAIEDYENGCEVSVTETVDPPVDITYSAVIMDSVHCRGGNDGIIVVSGFAGGLAPYVTTLSGPVAGTKTIVSNVVTFSHLIAGEYEVTVTDANGCPVVKSLEITEPDTIILAATWDTDISCTADGQFSIQASGGSGQFVYFADIAIPDEGHVLLPDPMTSDEWQTDSIFTVSVAGTYVVWAYDTINGCMVGGEKLNGVPVNEWRVKIEEPEVIVAFVASVTEDVLCFGDLTGEITISNITIDGVPVNSSAVNITINGNPAVTPIQGLAAGEYEIKVQDKVSGCSHTEEVTIDGPVAPLEVVLDKGEGEFTCPDAVQGYIEAIATGGAYDMNKSGKLVPYEYQLWQDGEIKTDYQEDYSFLVEIGHTYVVVVKDENGCTDTSNVMVVDPVAAVEIIDIMDATCADDTLGSALVTITGEPGRTFVIHWNQFENGGVPADYGETDTVEAGTIFIDQVFMFDNDNVEDIHYEIWVVDNMGCVSEPDTLTIDQKVSTPLVATVTVGDAVDCATEVMVSATGGVAPYMVVVNDTDTTEFDASTTLMLGGGDYTINVYDQHMCVNSFEEEIDYIYSLDTTFNIYYGDSAHVVYAPAMIDTFVTQSFVAYPEVSEGCIAEVKVTVRKRERTAPYLIDLSPKGRIGDNHPIFIMVFEDEVSFNETGYLTVTQFDSTDVILNIEITPDMFHGDSVIVDYDWTVVGKLDKSTRYVARVDSGVVMGDGLVWDGLQGIEWIFNTGPRFKVDVDPGLELTEFSVYPNPFDDRIYIDNSDKLTRVVITNIAGQRVMDVEYPEREIRTSNLVSGIYLVRMFTEDGLAKTDKIVKR
ncbi:MAG: T9SS type A sorting domain-containing protein [Prolixibacteraceae bacterium]|nr:T9SS type A sorting domain-containing protein [Prolixibacteraceae bacterium]